LDFYNKSESLGTKIVAGGLSALTSAGFSMYEAQSIESQVLEKLAGIAAQFAPPIIAGIAYCRWQGWINDLQDLDDAISNIPKNLQTYVPALAGVGTYLVGNALGEKYDNYWLTAGGNALSGALFSITVLDILDNIQFEFYPAGVTR
jgi:hypothetical protein